MEGKQQIHRMWAIQRFTYHKPRWIVFLPIWSSEERLSSSLLGKATQFMQVCWQEAALYGTMWRGTKDQKKTFCHLGMRKGCFLSCQAKNLLIRPAIRDARGEISLIQLSTLFSLSTLVIRKGAIISQFMRPTRPADAQSLTSRVVFALLFWGGGSLLVLWGHFSILVHRGSYSFAAWVTAFQPLLFCFTFIWQLYCAE